MNKPLSVSELNTQIKHILEETFLFVYVEGEISNLTIHTSGHIYFSLKDQESSISCVMFRHNAQHLASELKEGLKIEIIGELGVYLRRGNYQIICKKIILSKAGELNLAYEKLKNDLKLKGYFDHKKPLPLFPRKVALLTSITGAAIHDMLKTASKRWKLTQFVIIDTLVQGELAKHSIAKNIAHADKLGMDVIVLARGGGSTEDLWAFNEEMVADAIFQAQTPIISAIGHESDFVISDFVADQRAPTPTGAIETLLPDQFHWLYRVDEMRESLKQTFLRICDQKELSIEAIKEQYKILNPYKRLQTKQQECKQIMQMMQLRITNALEERRFALQQSYETLRLSHPITRFSHEVEFLKKAYALYNPTNKQGYAQITKDNKIITLSQLQDNDEFELTDLEVSIKARKLPKH